MLRRACIAALPLSLFWLDPALALTALQLTGDARADCGPAGPVFSVPAPPDPDPDLYCIELIPTPDHRDAFGRARLNHVSVPFGTAVSADGSHRYDLEVEVGRLPDPGTLGPYGTYVAWVTTPLLDPMVRLGEVGEGRVARGPVAFDRFLVLVSAEAHAHVAERTGPLVLRGTSASMRMLPLDDPVVLLGAASPPDSDHTHAAPAAEPLVWIPPPMDPRLFMPPGMMSLRPQAAPFLPGRDVDPLQVPEALPSQVIDLADGDSLELVAGLVRRTINGRHLILYGYNGQVPGPLLRVREGARVIVGFQNHLELPGSVHWHGVRLANPFDGVPHVTQQPVAPGESFRYIVHFPDSGIYWYHPHSREDIQQDLGLYGNIRVESADPGHYGLAHREEVLMLDDLLLGDVGIVPYGADSPTDALMGRFGNVFLVNGDPDFRLTVNQGEVVRFFLTNASSARTFHLTFGDARVKVVGSDLGRFEREEWVNGVVIAPAERYIVEARFERPGESALVNRVRAIDHAAAAFFEQQDTLVRVTVTAETATPDLTASFEQLRQPPEVAAEMGRYRAYLDRPVDHTLVLEMTARGLPRPIELMLRSDSAYFNPVEWSATMPMMSWVATGREVEWVLRDAATGRTNMDIDWRFRVGDVVRVRLVNNRATLHAMQHPIHLHGQRFLVLSRNGVPEPNLVWKDTLLLPVGQTADILLELSNPGRWLLHCHVAEHMETGMMMTFEVTQ